jgi:hypothetical protein
MHCVTCEKEVTTGDELYLLDDENRQRPLCEKCFRKAVKAGEQKVYDAPPADKPARKPRADKGVARGTVAKPGKVRWIALHGSVVPHIICESGSEREAIRDAEKSGQVTDDGVIVCRWNGRELKPTTKLA